MPKTRWMLHDESEKYIHIRVQDSLHSRMRDFANSKGMSASSWVRSLIVDAINKEEKQ